MAADTLRTYQTIMNRIFNPLTNTLSFGAVGFDADAQKVFDKITANGGTIGSPAQTAYNTFVVGAKADGFWSKLSIVAPYIGDQLAAALVAYNVQTTTAYVLTNNNFVTGDYTAASGLRGDASTKYLGTGFVDTTNSASSFSMGVYQTVNPDTGSKAAQGAIATGLNLLRSCPLTSDGSEFDIGGASTPIQPAFTYSKGWIAATRVGTAISGSQAAVPVATGTVTGALSGLEQYFFAANVANSGAAMSGATQGFAFIGTGLSATDVQNLAVRGQTLMDALGRNDRATVLAANLASMYATDKVTVTSGALTGTTIWLAAPFYAVGAAADTWLATSSNPTEFSNSDILGQINLYLGNTDVNGRFLCFVGQDSHLYYQAGDLDPNDLSHFPLGDPIWIGPMWCLDYYNRTGSLTPFTTYKAAMAGWLLNGANPVPRDANHLVFVPNSNATVWRPWGFQDGIDKAGADMFGSTFMYMADTAMATLYAAAGDATNAALFSADAALIKANISNLYDATSGMFFSCSLGGNATNLDVYASAMAVYSGLVTGSQATSVANYLIANYQAVFNKNGFAYESPTIWGQPRFDSPQPVGSYDDGAWSFGMLWVAYAISVVNPQLAHLIVQAISNGQDPTMEWWVRPPYTGGGGPTNGATNNMASIAQIYGASLLP